jgi:pimeloyl-ACP methyl ester carboxylesterase
MSTLPVPGARIYYETLGSGPLLVMVPGATGTAESLRKAAEHLAQTHTVAIYDRRGYSRSHLDGPPNHDHRLDTDADDLRRLIQHLTDQPATVFGVSSGATVALHLLTLHPDTVATLVPFEPPAVRLLPDGQKWVDFFHHIYDLYHQAGIGPALQQFRERTFAPSDRAAMAQAMSADASIVAQVHANLAYWFEHELRQYPATHPDLQPLHAHAERIVPAAGRDSPGYPCRQATEELASQLDRQLLDLPGGHVGCIAQPANFAAELLQALSDRTS